MIGGRTGEAWERRMHPAAERMAAPAPELSFDRARVERTDAAEGWHAGTELSIQAVYSYLVQKKWPHKLISHTPRDAGFTARARHG